MNASRTRAAGLPVAAALVLALALAGCGAGGFGSKEPTNVDTAIKSYVALGDGYTAAPYVGRTTAADGCLRSEDNYPSRVAESLAVTDFKDVSCVGATTKAITDKSRPPGATKTVKAQIDAIDPDTDLITIGIGIENSHLLSNLFRLCFTAVCGDKVPAGTVRDQLATISRQITATIRAVTSRAPQAYVVVVGYPELLPFERDCKDLPTMNDTQLFYATQGWDQFTTAVGSAARQAGAAYVDVRKLSEAHAPCTKDPWVNGDTTVKGKRVAYHPKAAEQKAVAEAITAAVRTR
jgi:hypothetical protein